MNMFLLVTSILFRLIAINPEFPVVYAHETFLGTGENKASIKWPVVEGDFAGVDRISELLDYESITGETIVQTRENYQLYGSGIVGAYFQVNYSDTQYLDLTITVETLGAYPSRMVFDKLFNLATGELITPNDLFLESELNNLVTLCDNELQNRIPSETPEDYRFTLENLEQVGVRRSGIIFHYDFQYPHVSEALEPDGELFFYWGDINKYLRPELRR